MNSIHYALFFVYLFCYVQIAPALEQRSLKEEQSSALEETTRDLNLHETIPKLVRQKRFFGAIIAIVSAIVTSVAATVIATQINKAIERSTGSSNAPPEQKPIIINNIINNNPPAAYQLKQEVANVNRRAGDAIRVSSRGYNCDHSFCRQVGDGPSSIGLCSPDICHCSNGQPIVQRCGTGTVFDPLYKVCNWPYNLKICGN